MALNKHETRNLYRKRARRYDLSVQIYRLFGFDLRRYQQDTIASLALGPGDLVVELGCGTGLNFEYIQRRIGPKGKIIGVDLTDSMLDVARTRVAKEGWANVELVQADVAEWDMPRDVDGVFSTLALTLVPEYDDVIEKASRALRTGGRLAVFDMKEPARWPYWLVRFAAWLNKPYGVSLELTERHPWESIRRYLTEIEFREYYFGALYLCVGEKSSIV
ncbi:MAG: methyltransferase domain-containing protein [Anaerolineales bacterium]|nr:methyltransferase domain-containing protein [Anaerolineales bacterium]